jgi:hypothetical protein
MGLDPERSTPVFAVGDIAASDVNSYITGSEESSMEDKLENDVARNVTYEEIEFEEYLKRPAPVRAVQVLEPFVVDAPDGNTQRGKPGDYLVEDITGERSPVDKRTFENSYDSLNPEDPETSCERREWYEIDWAGEVAGEIARTTLDALSDAHEELDKNTVEAHIEKLHIEVDSTTGRSGAQLVIVEPVEGGDNMD